MSELLSMSAYARTRKERGLPGGSHEAVRKAIATGRITLIKGKIDPDVADVQWAKRTAGSAPPEATASEHDDGGNFTDAKMAEVRARTKLLEIELAEKRGELVSAELVRDATFTKARIARDALMAIPARLSAQLAAESDEQAVRILLTKELRRICAEIAGEQVPTIN